MLVHTLYRFAEDIHKDVVVGDTCAAVGHHHESVVLFRVPLHSSVCSAEQCPEKTLTGHIVLFFTPPKV